MSKEELQMVGDFISYVASVRTKNQPEWMEGLCDRINDMLKQLDVASRVELRGRRAGDLDFVIRPR